MQEDNLLVVDDEFVIRNLSRHVLENAGYKCYTAANVVEAKAVLAQYRVSLILSDLQMPGESGMDLLNYTQEYWPSIATVIVTGSADISTAIEAVRLGAYDYICKPFRAAELPLKVRIALENRSLVLDNRKYRQGLETKVDEQTHEIRKLYQRERERARALEEALEDVKQAHLQAQEALIGALGLRDCETKGHCRRVMRYSSTLSRALDLPNEDILYTERGALLHDIGKIGIPDAILLKPSPLTDEEWDLMRKHTIHGASMISGIRFLGPASPVVLYHHERYDGTGYPYGLQGDEIPIGARIFAIADALDAITSKRPYKEALPFEEALHEIQRSAGSHFDPDIVAIFMSIPAEQWQAIRDQVESEIANPTQQSLQDDGKLSV